MSSMRKGQEPRKAERAEKHSSTGMRLFKPKARERGASTERPLRLDSKMSEPISSTGGELFVGGVGSASHAHFVRLGQTDPLARLHDMEEREKEWWKFKGFLKDTKERSKRRMVVQQRVETFMGQVLMAKSAGMSLYNNNKFEQSYITFKAEAETLRTMSDQTIKNSTVKPFLRPTPPYGWDSLDPHFSNPAEMPYKKNSDNEEENYIIFCTMVRVKMEVALQESSMLMNPELSFKERVEEIKKAFDFVLATEEIFADEAPEPVTPEPTRKPDEFTAFNFQTSGLDDFIGIERIPKPSKARG